MSDHPHNTNFYPRSPCGERLSMETLRQVVSHFYPRSPCGERPHPIDVPVRVVVISIHALLAESDTIVNNIVLMPGKFLSTLSLRRATKKHLQNICMFHYFYPRSPCGERLCILHHLQRLLYISIHALLAESDFKLASYAIYY